MPPQHENPTGDSTSMSDDSMRVFEFAGGRVTFADGDGEAVTPSVSMADARSGDNWADGRWEFRLEVECDGVLYRADGVQLTSSAKKGQGWRFALKPLFDREGGPDCEVEWHVRGCPSEGWTEERVCLRNGSRPIRLRGFRTTLALRPGARFDYWPVPFPPKGKPLTCVDLAATGDYEESRDGAVLLRDGGGIVVARAPAVFEQEPLFIGVRRGSDGARIGSLWRGGLPQPGATRTIRPAERWDWGAVRYTPFAGPLESALNLYRSFMAGCGVKLPADYAPPLNYCIYYECKKYYTRQQLLQCLDYAAELGCGLLYTDQGWEDYFSSGRWDETRFGPIEDIVRIVRERGLAIGFLVGLHADSYVWPEECRRRAADGSMAIGDRWGHWAGVCPVSKSWQRTKTRRLSAVALSGVRFFSFDFNDGIEPCFDASHGHDAPLDIWEHALGVARQQRAVKKASPQTLVEAHCWRTSGGAYWPMYTFQGAHDERWGFEFMWDPYADLKQGRLQRLYYYNLAYEKPLYLHIDLAKDNANQLVFWYAASTIRHLGIGNYSALADDRKARVRQAVALYAGVREYFTRGVFSGPDPLTHVHVLPGRGALVLRFNTEGAPARGRFALSAESLGCAGAVSRVETLMGDSVRATVTGEGLVVEYELGEESALMLSVT